MIPDSTRNVFSDSAKLSLPKRQHELILPLLLEFLERNKSQVGQVLLDFDRKPWKPDDMRHLESIILTTCCDKRTVCDFLRVLRKAAQFWSVRERCIVNLPRIPVEPPRTRNPFCSSLATRSRQYNAWKLQLQKWLLGLNSVTDAHDGT